MAILSPKEAKKGKFGVGYFSVFARAAAKGKCDITVRVEMSDGKRKDVPFAFEVD